MERTVRPTDLARALEARLDALGWRLDERSPIALCSEPCGTDIDAVVLAADACAGFEALRRGAAFVLLWPEDHDRLGEALQAAHDRAMARALFRQDSQDREARRRADADAEAAMRELAVARDAAMKADRAKSAFLAAMSHELRTPLTAILGYADLLRETLPGPEATADLDCIHAAGTHLLALVDEVLDLARVESGRIALRREPVALLALAQVVADTLRPKAQSRGQQIVVLGTEGEVQSDPLRLRQILINLLGNATKYAAAGSLRIGVRWDPRAVLFVEDEGPGLSEAQLARIFVPFAQLGATGEGVGLGLAICERLAAALGISLTVSSQLGRGTRFELAF